MSLRNRSVACLIALAVLAGAARAQNDIQPTFEFSFSNPGARSMGLGGAFASLADDATAAFANPAGLVQIAQPELSVEGRAWSYSTPFVAGGRIFGEPTGSGLDSTPGLRWGESSANLAGVSFLSFVYPGKRWSLALSRHQLANFEIHSSLQGLYSGPWSEDIQVRREYDQDRTADLEMLAYSLAGALRLSDTLSVGLGLSHLTTHLASTSGIYADFSPSSFFQAAPVHPDNLVYSTSLAIDGTDWTLSAGLLWRFAHRWRLGGFFREGPEPTGLVSFRAGPLNPFGLPVGAARPVVERPMPFPDVYGLGLSYRAANERLTLSFEWDRIGYSSLLEFYNADGFENRIDDGSEVHVGAEYLLVHSRPMLALRAGAWLEPAHLISNAQGYVTEAILPPGDDELHLAIGLGIALWEVQLDLAADFSDRVDSASISTVYSF